MKMALGYLRRAYSIFTSRVIDVPPRLLSLLFLLLLLVFPVTKPESYILGIMIQAQILAVFAASWDLLVGRSGQLSLGHALFFGVGAYASALLFKHFSLPMWASIPLGIIACLLVAFLVGFPCLRVKGPYLALVTLAFPIILLTVFLGLPTDIAGKENGITNLPIFFPIKEGLEWKAQKIALYQQNVAQYYLMLLLLFVSAYILYRIAHSKTGIILVSILDDEVASKASGINTTKYKLMAFAVSGVFGGLAGCLYAHSNMSGGIVAPVGTLALTTSFLPVILTILGGIGTIYGPIAGAFVLMFLGEILTEIVSNLGELMTSIGLASLGQHLKWNVSTWAGSGTTPGLIFMIIVIILVVKWPRGIARSMVDKLEDLSEERELEERGKSIWKREKRNSLVHEG